MNNVNDAHTVACIDISDHRLVRCKAKLDIVKPQKKKSKPSYNVESLEDKEVREKYQENIKKHLENNQWQNVDSPEDINSLLTGSVKKAADSLPKKPRQKKEWISQATLDSIDIKHEARAKPGDKSITYKMHKANVKKMCQIDLETYIDKQHKELNQAYPKA